VRQGNPGSTGPNGNQVPIAFDTQLWHYLNRLPCGAVAEKEPAALSNHLFVVPNPAENNWRLRSNDHTPHKIRQIRLTNAQGVICWSLPDFSTQEELLVPGELLPAGIYFLTWQENLVQKSIKLVKM
jgi:hypothetical protein